MWSLNIFKSLQLFFRSCTGANFRLIPFGIHRRFHHPLVSEGVKHLHVSQVFITIMAPNSINFAWRKQIVIPCLFTITWPEYELIPLILTYCTLIRKSLIGHNPISIKHYQQILNVQLIGRCSSPGSDSSVHFFHGYAFFLLKNTCTSEQQHPTENHIGMRQFNCVIRRIWLICAHFWLYWVCCTLLPQLP